jgi:endonuclease G
VQRKKTRKKAKSRSRRIALKLGAAFAVLVVAWGVVGEWFAHHPRAWVAEQSAAHPVLSAMALWLGNPVSDITDGLGWTGHDVVYEYDTEPPSGSVTFAGTPARVGAPAPEDIRVVDRGEFAIGWSDSLRHPVWCAYHVRRDARHPADKRPSFTKDPSVPAAPSPGEYTRSNYDRGHMAPNYAIATRYGKDAQKLTFKMSNIAPQTPELNRGVWRDVEHRIADLWTARYGEIWVVVGCISRGNEKIGQTGIDVPTDYYQVIMAQDGMDVRALAVLIPQSVGWGAWAARHIVSIDELEEMTGLDFNPNLESFIQSPLEAETPTRLWPVNALDIFRQVMLRFEH